ncbi:MAG: aldose epimerase family protein [Acidobacteriota bacterium]
MIRIAILLLGLGCSLPAQTPQVFTLKNSAGMEAVITNYGAILMSLKAPGRDGKLDDVVLGFDSPAEYIAKSQHPYFGAVVGRYGNRIAKAQFTLDGKTYKLAANDGPNALHGGLKGFDKRFWSARQQGNVLTLELLSKDGEEGYPGELRAKVTYTLTSKNELRIDYQATTNQPAVVNLTNHSYFNLGGKAARHILGHTLKLNASRFTPVAKDLIPTGEIKPVAGTPFDFTKPTPIGSRIEANDPQLKLGGGYDHNFVFDKGLTAKPELVAEVFDPSSGRQLDVYTTEPGVQLYTSNFLDGKIAGKGGVKYERRHALCLETQHFPDSPNQPAFSSTLLRPADTYKSTTIFHFRVR